MVFRTRRSKSVDCYRKSLENRSDLLHHGPTSPTYIQTIAEFIYFVELCIEVGLVGLWWECKSLENRSACCRSL